MIAARVQSLTPSQERFMCADDPLYMFCGGVGSGKTRVGSMWAYEKAYFFPGAVGFIGANTYLQLHKNTLPPFFAYLREQGMAFVHNKKPPAAWRIPTRYEDHKNVLTLANGAQILTYSLDNYDPIRGMELGWFWIDETRDSPPQAFDVLLERLRGFDKSYPGMRYEARVTTTPNGFDWLWEKFVNPDTRIQGAGYVTASSHDNPFLPGDYATVLESRLGKKLARQQIYAEFLSLTAGRAFAFDRNRHVGEPEFNPGLALVFSMDFNVAPLCGVVMQIDVSNRRVAVLDEIVLPDDGITRAACDEFARRWKAVLLEDGSIIEPAIEIFGDISGRSRSTRGGDSDLETMKKTLESHFKSVRDMGPFNQQFVSDGVNAVNALLDPMDGEPRMVIHRDRCPMLMRDLEQVAWKPGTRELDKSNGQLTHVSDALRYPVCDQLPVEGYSTATRFEGVY